MCAAHGNTHRIAVRCSTSSILSSDDRARRFHRAERTATMRRCAVVRRPAPSTTTTTTMTKSGMRTFVSPPHQRRRGPPPGFPRRRWKRLSRRWCDRCVVASSWSCCFDITRCYTSLRGDRCRPSCRIPHDKKHNDGGNLQQNPGGYIRDFLRLPKSNNQIIRSK